MKVTTAFLIGVLTMLGVSKIGRFIADNYPYLLRACHDGTDKFLFKSKSGQYSITRGGTEFKISPDANIEKDVCAL